MSQHFNGGWLRTYTVPYLFVWKTYEFPKQMIEILETIRFHIFFVWKTYEIPKKWMNIHGYQLF
jgi:hypothetical protein